MENMHMNGNKILKEKNSKLKIVFVVEQLS